MKPYISARQYLGSELEPRRLRQIFKTMRKTFLGIAGYLMFTGFSVAIAAEKPDIVVFLADDLGWRDCSIYGSKETRTPNMARLAANGMTFSHAFVSSATCAPSRAALLTGLDPMRNGAMLNHTRPRADVKRWPAYFREAGYEVVAIGKVAHYAEVKDYRFDHASHFSHDHRTGVDAAVKWLGQRKSKKPLCLLVGSSWPHIPWPKKSDFDPAKLTMPPKLVDTPATRRALARYYTAVGRADRDLGRVYDAARKHLGDRSIFVFSGDQGPQFPFGKWNGYDSALRAPLVVVWPGKIRAGSTSAAMVGLIDLLPTLLDATGFAPPEKLSGRSFVGILSGQKTDHRNEIFATHSGDGINRYPLRVVRTHDWKYIRNLDPDAKHHTIVDKSSGYWKSWQEKAKIDPAAAATIRSYHERPAEELYDLRVDPDERNNLAGVEAHAVVKAKLRASLDTWMQASGDEGLKTERNLRPQEK